VSFVGFGVVGSTRRVAAAGKLDIIPVGLSEVPRLLRVGPLRVDVLILQVSGRDQHSAFSLGAVNGYIHEALPRARVVIAEVSTTAPWTYSQTTIRREDVTLTVGSNRPMVQTVSRPPTARDDIIGRSVADLVPDGATLQLGIGGVPSAVTRHLTEHSNLGLHSGVIGDSVLPLIKSGVIDNSRKTFDAGVSVAGLLAGTDELYAFADENPRMRIEPVSYTHDFSVLRRLPSLVAINSALEVDLTGQIGAEVADRENVGTIGGQTDFIRGALANPGGRSIIGLPARTGRTASPRIVPLLTSGIVTTPRSEADIVVTEYGVAHLRGRSIRERVHADIAISHPDDRAYLAEEARKLVAGYSD